jgi:hypothetical protein
MHSVFKKLKEPKTVLTPNGMKSFDGVVQYSKNVLEITTEQTTLEVAEKHIFVVDDNEIFAKDLNIGDILQTVSGYSVVSDIVELGEKDVYDLVNVDGELYYTNGILSHNTFLGSSYTLIDAEKLGVIEPKIPLEIVAGKLKIYEEYIKGHNYICSVDAAKNGIDGFVVNFVDITNFKFRQVATANLDIDYLLMPRYISDWCQMYNNPYLIIENNEGAGQSVADQMHLTYEYENLHFDKNVGTKNNVHFLIMVILL